jgi:hypothetical protein
VEYAKVDFVSKLSSGLKNSVACFCETKTDRKQNRILLAKASPWLNCKVIRIRP